MSSTTEALNKAETEEPSSKKVKLDGGETAKVDVKSSDNNNGTTADEKARLAENNNGTLLKSDQPASGSGGVANQIPSKTANGANKETKAQNLEGSEEDDDDDDQAFGDPKITQRLKDVDDIQQEILLLNEQASEEILMVEKKFNELRRPFYEKRNALLKDVPNFWLAALANHPMISSMIQSAEDEDCLHYMSNIDVEELDIKSGYNLKFYFTENPYIKNDLIVRELRLHDHEEVVSQTTPIEYKDTQQGKKLREVVENSLAQYRRKVRDDTPEILGSFFAWLSQEQEITDPVAELIKEQIWTSPVEYFLNNAEDYEDSQASDDEEDYDDEEAIDNDLEAGIPDEDELAELQEMEGEEFDDEEEDLDEDDDEDDEDDDEGEEEE